MIARDISKIISISELKKLLSYNPEDGLFRWVGHQFKTIKAGAIAGFNRPPGYVQININNKQILAHRLAWYYMTGENPCMAIDHINGDKKDNRISNLRLVNHSQNAINSNLKSDNKSGCKGVFWNKRKQRWYVTPRLNGKKIYLGSFINKTDAITAYCDFAREHHGEYQRTN
ncbi:HNH endonuclease [Yersinia rochesterensis]|uniref:HNH endonuclease n=1 Tax=Yersinia rochesterensis TaxID=1604335 RepID=UPI0004F5960F|nr:HNH endonuclease [Yersinia rochesterensis]AIN18817.1 AP2 domain protein [Yersinia rochesterensis]